MHRRWELHINPSPPLVLIGKERKRKNPETTSSTSKGKWSMGREGRQEREINSHVSSSILKKGSSSSDKKKKKKRSKTGKKGGGEETATA